MYGEALEVSRPALAVRIKVDPINIKQPDRIRLEMSIQEARTLKQVCNLIGGDPMQSARMHMDAINEGLVKANISTAHHPLIREYNGPLASIYFADEEVSTL